MNFKKEIQYITSSFNIKLRNCDEQRALLNFICIIFICNFDIPELFNSYQLETFLHYYYVEILSVTVILVLIVTFSIHIQHFACR